MIVALTQSCDGLHESCFAAGVPRRFVNVLRAAPNIEAVFRRQAMDTESRSVCRRIKFRDIQLLPGSIRVNGLGRRETSVRMGTTDESVDNSMKNSTTARDPVLATQESQLQGYEAAATSWVIGAGLHVLSFSLLNPASWTTRAMFALAYSHFLLFLLSIRAMCVAVSEGLSDTEVYQQLNLAMAFSALLSAFISVTKFLLQGVVEIAVPATAVVAASLTAIVSLRTWQVTRGSPTCMK